MKIIVPVKRVVDYNVRIRVKADESGVETNNVKMSMNPFDEIAVEQAIRLKESGVCDEIIAVSIGPTQSQDTIRTALAMGADRGVLVETDILTEPLAVAKIIAKLTNDIDAGLLLLGKQAIDDDANQTAQMLAALLDWPQVTFVSRLNLDGDKVEATREIDGGMETLAVNLPAVISVDLRLNEPRYASLPNIMKARKKQLDVMTPAELGIDVEPRLTTVKVCDPPPRKTGKIVSSISELVDKLRDEEKVI